MTQLNPSDTDRTNQQLISEKDGTEPLTALAAAPSRGVGEVRIPADEATDSADAGSDNGVDDEEQYAPRSLASLLSEAAGAEGMLRLTVRPELNFVVNIFNDDVQTTLVELANFEFDGQKLNVLQPLSKMNEKSKRVGVLREPLRNFVHVLNEVAQLPENIVIGPDSAARVVDALIAEHNQLAENTLYSNFPLNAEGIRVIEVPGEDGEPGLYIPASEFIRIRPMVEAHREETEPGSAFTDIVVTCRYVIHLRVPLLLREASDKFERTLKSHFKFLEQCGIKAGLPTTVYAGFNSVDLVSPTVNAALDWLRETDPALSILSYRNVSEGGEFFGIPGFTTADYAEALFNGGDFIVAFQLENEGE